MSEPGFLYRGRTFLAGKIVSNFGQSSIDCVVRRLSDNGASVEVESVFDVPEQFILLIPGDHPRPCKRAWQSDKQIGVVFETTGAGEEGSSVQPRIAERRGGDPVLRTQMLALRAALDETDVGIVLLDRNLRVQFMNRAFRVRGKLPDAFAKRHPTFAEILSFARDSSAYQLPAAEVDAYVAERLRLVKAGDTKPIDLRRSDGGITRLQCAVLPDGGRMVSYTPVSDIVKHSDELEALRTALENVDEGIVLLDADLNVRFLNEKMRKFWGVSTEQAACRPAYEDLVAKAASSYDHGSVSFDLNSFVAQRVEAVRNADPALPDLRTADGRHIRVNCAHLKDGGRMLTYCDVTDLVRNAEKLERLATTDSMTGLYNRRHFLDLAQAEWSRFQRYHRPLSMLMVDIDHFKEVNDGHGHAVGDETIVAVARACTKRRRGSDIVGRLGGEEFAILLPETDLTKANIVADRLCKRIAAQTVIAHQLRFKVTVSIGVAASAVSMSGIDVLMRAADHALYQAKSEGRNRTAQWSPPIAPKIAAE